MMKKLAVQTFTFITIYLFSIYPTTTSAQVIAGSVPAGTSVQFPNIMLADSIIGMTVSDSFDIDCDNIKDIALDLIRQNTAVDWPNLVMLRILSDSVEICKDTSSPYEVALYNIGDTLCNGLYAWRADSVNRVACGGIFCWGLYEASDKYFAFRKTSTQEIGWVKISYDLAFQNTITDTVDEILVLCTGTGTGDMVSKSIFNISPNPFSSSLTLHFPSPQNSQALLKIFNSIGEVVVEKEIKLEDQRLNLAALPQGIYLVSVLSEGRVYNQKIIKW